VLVTLTQDACYFEREGNLLSRTDRGLGAGSEFEVGKPVKLFYDHRVQTAVPFSMDGKTYYMIVSEMGLFPELQGIYEG